MKNKSKTPSVSQKVKDLFQEPATPAKAKKKYEFGQVKKATLDEIEKEVLSDNVYLEVFAGSDLALKENVQEFLPTEAQNILNMGVYRYDYKKDLQGKNLPTTPQIGFMAQELQKSFPECIKEDQDGMLYVNYSMLVPVLTETVKTLNERISVLEKKISEK